MCVGICDICMTNTLLPLLNTYVPVRLRKMLLPIKFGYVLYVFAYIKFRGEVNKRRATQHIAPHVHAYIPHELHHACVEAILNLSIFVIFTQLQIKAK